MKRLIIFILPLFYFGSYGQSPLDVGEKQFNAGLGFSDNGIPIYVGADFGVAQNITLGAELSYRNIGDQGFDLNTLGLVGIFDYHLDELLSLSPEWNVYAGANAGCVAAGLYSYRTG